MKNHFCVFMHLRLSSYRCTLILAGLMGLASVSAQAERADRFKKIEVESDQPGKMDLQKKRIVFNGNVVVSKGSLFIRAGRIEVQEKEGQHQAVAFAGPGALATFRQKREGVDEFIEGQAERVEYDSKLETVRFINQAQVRRMRGREVLDQANGALIVYDNAAEVFTVSGGATGVTSSNPGGRVKVVISPRESAP